MKPLNAELVPPPQLDAFQLAEFEQRVDGLIKSYEDAMSEFCKKLARFEKMHRDDMAWRAEPGTIFALSNIQVPICKSIAVSYAAKFYQVLVGDSMLNVKPQGVEDKSQAEKLMRYWRFELDDQAHISESRAKTCQIVSVKGTSVTKRRWKTVSSYYNRMQKQLHDESGQPVVNHMGLPVTPSHPQAEFPHENLLYRMAGAKQKRLDFGGKPGPMLAPDSDFRSVQIKDKVVHYDNLEIVNIRMDDFICDLTVADLDDSELKGHRYDMKLWEVMEKIISQAQELEAQGRPLPSGELPPGWIREGIDLLKTVKGDSGAEGSKDGVKARQPQDNLGEKSFGGLTWNKTDELKEGHYVEVHIKHDTDGDGLPEDVIGIFETTLKKFIYLDWHVNLYVDCKTAFYAHRIFPVDDRWYGMGPYEVLASLQDYIDHVFNRVNYRSGMNANPATWMDPTAFENSAVEWGPGCKFIVKQGRNGANAFGFYVMPVIENVELQNLQMFISLAQMISGVMNPGATGVGNAKPIGTATGVDAVSLIKDEMMAYHIACLLPSLERETEGAVSLEQQNISEDRVFRYMKGADEITAVVTPQQIRELNFDVKITLNKAGDQQKIQATQMAIQHVISFISLPAAQQSRLRGLFVKMFEMLGFVEADDLLPSIEELQKDQQDDQVLQKAIEKVMEAVQKIQAANLDPSKVVVQDLMQSLEMIQSAIALPAPDTKQGGMGQLPTGEQPGPRGGGAGEPPPDEIPPAPSPAPAPSGAPTAPQAGAAAQLPSQ